MTTETMIEDTPDDDTTDELEAAPVAEGPKELREALKREQTARKEAEAKLRQVAFREAGFDPNAGVGKLLASQYDGEPEVDAIRAFATEYGLDTGSTPAPAVAVDDAQARVDAVVAASTSQVPDNLEAQIAQAEAEGDFAAALTLKSQWLGANSRT